MDFVEQVHIFGLTNIHTFGPKISLIRIFSLIFNYAKPRMIVFIMKKESVKLKFPCIFSAKNKHKMALMTQMMAQILADPAFVNRLVHFQKYIRYSGF